MKNAPPLEGQYPLSWPSGWKRTPPGGRTRSYFKPTTFARVRDELAAELQRLGARSPILSTNLELRLDGQPRAERRMPDDPGVAVYFTLTEKLVKGPPRKVALACDRWTRIEDNVHALELHIASMRGQERWGVGSIDQAFTGYTALPAPGEQPWFEVLALAPNAGEAEIRARWRDLAQALHPDVGGSSSAFSAATRARDEGIADARQNGRP